MNPQNTKAYDLDLTQKTAIVLVGVAGSGKSTTAETLMSDYIDLRGSLLSSDSIRLELFGKDYKYNPEDNRAVFDELDKRKADLINLGHHIILDATNTNLKSRIHNYTNLKKAGYNVINIFHIKSLSQLNYINEIRDIDKRVPLDSVKRQYINLEPSYIDIDCDDIIISNNSTLLVTENRITELIKVYESAITSKSELKEIVKNIKHQGLVSRLLEIVRPEYLDELLNLVGPHDTPYHLEDINEHIDMVIINTAKVKEAKQDLTKAELLLTAAIFHDLGKSVTKEGGRYIGHANVSAMYLFGLAFALRSYRLYDSYTLFREAILIVHTHMAFKNEDNEPAKLIKRLRLTQEELNNIYLFRDIDNMSRII